MSKHVFHIVIKPHDVNLAAQDGRLLIIVPNYSEVFDKAPVVTDGQSQVFQVEVDSEEMAEVKNGNVKELRLWKGDTNSRARPQDKHQLPVASLIPLGEKSAKAQA